MALVEEIIHEVPGVAHTVATSGMSFIAQANSSNFGSMFVVLKPFDERRRNPALGAEAIMAKLRKEFARRVKDARVVVYNSSPVPGLGTAGGFKVIVEDRGDLGLDVLQSQTDDLVRKLQAEHALASATTQFRSKSPQFFLDIDRTKIEALGVTFNDVNQTLSMYLGSLYVNSLNEFGRHWQVTIQVEGKYPQPGRRYQLVTGAQQIWPDGAARYSGQRARDRRADRVSHVTTCIPPRPSRAACARVSARATRSRRSIASAPKVCRFR